ncbi:GNAT family protein [Cytobacillus sp. FSL R7-0696]|uniref:GNAT family N-acetyltransferase n=1 Tax=Cytobacillus sp. FSL R7-0696 TaxID=2921691 RepID=UPI0030F5F03D
MIKKLNTPRLLFKKMDVLDSAELFQIWSDPEVTKFMNIESFNNENQVKEMILLFDKLSKNDEAIRYTLIELKSNQIIGTCGFNYIDFENAKAEIGYDLNKIYWGQGFAKEAITCLIQHAFNVLNLNRIEAKIEPENTNSIQLIEKLNFTYEGTLRQSEKSKGRYIDLKIYSKLASDS